MEMQWRDWLIPLENNYSVAFELNFRNGSLELNASLSVELIDPHMLFPSIPTTCTLMIYDVPLTVSMLHR